MLVDPVMGDHGRAYRTCTPELCARMGELAAQADVITPNLTEAALLLGEDYQAQPDRDTVRSWLERLSLNGRRSVVLTGVSAGAEQVGAASLDHVTGKMELALTHREQGSFPGTGDLFAAVLLVQLVLLVFARRKRPRRILVFAGTLVVVLGLCVWACFPAWTAGA